MHVGAVARPDGKERLRGVGGDDDDVGHVVSVVESSQELVAINKFGVFIGYDFGNRLDASGLLRLESADGDIRVLE